MTRTRTRRASAVNAPADQAARVGRPSEYGEPMVRRALFLPQSTWDELDARAAGERSSPSKLIRQALELEKGSRSS